MKQKTLVAFGDSCTFGHGLEDCIASDGFNPGKTPSKFAWPTLLAEKLNASCSNLGIPGASNKEIWNKIMNTKLGAYQTTEIKNGVRQSVMRGNPDENRNIIVIIGWSLFNRSCVLRKNSVEQIGVWQDSKASKSYFKHLYDDHDMNMDFYLRANFVKEYLNNLGITNYHWRLETTLEDEQPEWNTVQFFDFEYHKLKKKYPLALDDMHPGPQAHAELAEVFYSMIKGTRSSVG